MQKIISPNIKLLGIMTLTYLLTACASFNYVKPDAPVVKSMPQRIEPQPRVAVVLGSGGPRGYAHIGVIKVLEGAGSQPDITVGSSVGAVPSVISPVGIKGMEYEDAEESLPVAVTLA